MKENTTKLLAGAEAVNITPKESLYLAGYPFVERTSTGIHDPLMSSALFLSDGKTSVIFIANDVIFVNRKSVARVRRSISGQTGVPEKNIMITATHTHSGPSTVTFTAGTQDPLLPKVNTQYVQFMEDGMIKAACMAAGKAVAVELGVAKADATGIGTNRHDPSGPSDMEVPVLLVRSADTSESIACMLICSMHPTVLHEDSTLYSGDFPGLAKSILQKEFLGERCPILFHLGAAGNQSPRHVTKENTFHEAQRIGNILAQSVAKVIPTIDFYSDIPIAAIQHFINLPKRLFPGISEAKVHLEKSIKKLEELKNAGKTRQEIRSAEVNWFGAVESLHLAELSKSNALDEVYQACLPAEIQLFKIGLWSFISWPGEIFIEYALEIKEKTEDVFVITLANGELQGYIVTEEASGRGGYEASNAIFDHKSGDLLVSESLHLLDSIKQHGSIPGN